ncbi:MAG: S8 family serine peptidase [Kibdelosporangium sp.]
MPQHLLERHGARVLNPVNALVSAAPFTAPRSTVYRTGALLIPNEVLLRQENIRSINDVLERIDLEMVPPRGESFERFSRLPRPVPLRVREKANGPTQVDSWLALQELRTAGNKGSLSRTVTDRISVEHLLFATVDIGGTPWEASGAPGGGGYVRTGTTGRIPVSLAVPAPPRREVDRRPVVAVLDTGIGPHPWFGFTDRTAPPPAGGFIRVFPQLQEAIRLQELETATTTPTRILHSFWDEPGTDNPLIGELDRNTGHGTFIAGIVRQSAPEADVLSIRVLHSDGIAYESDVLLALWTLVARVQQAQQDGKLDDMVDVVSLSLGYFDESGTPFTTHLVQAIDELRKLGVLVVAAAGNDATTRRFYPAALADRPLEPGHAPQVISVGALNPSNTKALFSNEASWVRCWATGAGVVSTYPIDVRGSATATNLPAVDRGALDPDDYQSGFAVWDGTSFAAPLAAATLTSQLIACAEQDATLGLKAIEQGVAVKRALAALQKAGG